MGHCGYDSSPTTREVGEHKGAVHLGAEVPVGTCQTPSVPVRANPGCTSCCALDKGKIQRDPKDGARQLRRHQAVGQEEGDAEQVGQGGHHLVAQLADQRLQTFAQKCPCLGDCQIGHRCNGHGHRGGNEWYRDVRGTRQDHLQLDNCTQGVAGLREDGQAPPSKFRRKSCMLACRQHQCETGMAEQWDKAGQMALQEGCGPADHPPPEQHGSCTGVCEVCPASARRFDKSEQGPTRLAPEQGDGQEAVQDAGPSRSGLDGHLAVTPGPPVLLSSYRRGSLRGGRVHQELGPVQHGLRVPQSHHVRVDTEQDIPVQQGVIVHCHNSVETEVTVVSQGSGTLGEEASEVASQLEDGDGHGLQQLHPGHALWQQDKIRRLAAFRKSRAEVRGLSTGAVKTLQSSWAENTQGSYGLAYRYYTQFCREHHLDELEPSAINLINFLQYELEENKRPYRTINLYRSAVSSTLGTCPILGKPVGQDPLVCRYMRGILRLNPPKAKLFPTWDVTQVLDYLKKWGDMEPLTLKNLLMKTAFLVALVCCKRPADLCNMQIVKGYWHLSMSGFSCQPLGFGKTETHNPTPPIVIEPFWEDPRLCPVHHLVTLDKKLKTLRPDSVPQFWISSRKPYQAVKAQTMSKWLTEVITSSGCMGGTARDIRSVGASTAVQSGLDIRTIMKAADWQRISTLQSKLLQTPEAGVVIYDS